MDNKQIEEQVTEYVYKNYPTYKDKQLIINELGNHFKVYKHKDASPLVLGFMNYTVYSTGEAYIKWNKQ